jgi:hypothetical protein
MTDASQAAAESAANKPPAAAKTDQKPIELLRGIVKGLPENRLKLVLSSAADMGNGFAAVLPTGVKFDEVFEPSFWAHCAYKLRPGDEITVHSDDMSFRGHIYVRDASAPANQKMNNRAVVSLISYVEFEPMATGAKTKTHEVVFLGPHMQWCVKSLKDQRVVKERCGTAGEAAEWMRTQAA